jgi:hypothetical protein
MYIISVVRPEGKRSLARPSNRNRLILKDPKEVTRLCENLDWIHLNQNMIQSREFVNPEMNIRVS